MSRLFIGNFSFEQTLYAGHNPGRSILRFESELACIWLAVAAPGDEILCANPPGDDYLQRMELLGCSGIRWRTPEALRESAVTTVIPWGWTPSIRKLCQQNKLKEVAPPQEVVQLVNSRQFQVEISDKLGCLLPGEGIATGLPDLMPLIQALHRQHRPWIIKPNLGQAGKGQFRGEGPFLSESQFGTILHLLSQHSAVAVEPLLDAVSEIGCQWEISPDGESKLIGMTQLISDRHGRYQGTRLNSIEMGEQARENVLKTQQSAVRCIAEAGYFGPLGIDAMLYRQPDGEIAIRPIQDINARWTMGRIGWEWSRRLERGNRAGGWYHSEVSPATEALMLSPDIIDESPVRCRTWWLDEGAPE